MSSQQSRHCGRPCSVPRGLVLGTTTAPAPGETIGLPVLWRGKLRPREVECFAQDHPERQGRAAIRRYRHLAGAAPGPPPHLHPGSHRGRSRRPRRRPPISHPFLSKGRSQAWSIERTGEGGPSGRCPLPDRPQPVSPGLPSLGRRLPCPPGSAPALPGAGPSSTGKPQAAGPAPPHPHPCPSLAGVREGRDQELTRTQPHTQRPASSNPQSHAASVVPCASVTRPHLHARCDVAFHVM